MIYSENVKQQSKLLKTLNCLWFCNGRKNMHREKIYPFQSSLTGWCSMYHAFVSSTKMEQCHSTKQSYTEREYL